MVSDKRIKNILMSSTIEEEIISIFATHFSIRHSNLYFDWVYDRESRTQMRNLCRSNPDATVKDWVEFLVNNPSQPLRNKLLSAFLEKIGTKYVWKVYEEQQSYQNSSQLSYDLDDFYQLAFVISSDVKKFFESYTFDYVFEKFVNGKMKNKLKEESAPLKRRSDWGLLKSATRKYLKEALENKGDRQPLLDRYLTAHKSFKEIYDSDRPTPNSPLPEPTDEQFQQIANRYNQLAQSSPQVADRDRASQNTIKECLERCIEALRWHENRVSTYVDSLDEPVRGDGNSHSLSETISDDQNKSSWKLTEDREIQEWTHRLEAVLRELLTQIDNTNGNYLLLKYGFDLNSRSIASIFGFSHSTISRRNNRQSRLLIGQLGQWARENLNITPDSENLSRQMSELKNSLKKHYKDLIFESVFQTAWQQLDRQHQKILYLHYFKQINELAIADQLQLVNLEVNNGLATGKQTLVAAIKEWIQNRLNVSPDLLDPLTDQIATFVERMIADYLDPNFMKHGENTNVR